MVLDILSSRRKHSYKNTYINSEVCSDGDHTNNFLLRRLVRVNRRTYHSPIIPSILSGYLAETGENMEVSFFTTVIADGS